MDTSKKSLSSLLRLDSTVFTFKEIALLWGGTDKQAAIARVDYYVRTGELYRIRRGIYAKDKNYNVFELAAKILTPAYVSFETVLGQAGVIFQYYSQVFAASYTTREIIADGKTIIYKRIQDKILTNTTGVNTTGHYAIACAERAFLDVVYLNTQYHFDHLSVLNWDKIFEILPIYGGNKRMQKMVRAYHLAAKSSE